MPYRDRSSQNKTSRKIIKLENYKSLAIKRGGEYKGDIIPTRIQDKSDQWYCNQCKLCVEMSYVNLRKSQQFSCCNPYMKKTLEDYKNMAIERGGTYILDHIPEHSHIPVEGWCCEVKDHERYIWSTCYNAIMNGHWCAICAKNKPKTLEDYKKLAKEIGWKYVLDDIPVNVGTYIEGWECKEEHIVETSYASLYMGHGCIYCYGNNKRELSHYQEIGKELEIKYILDYIPENSDTRINGWECKEKHVFESSYGNIRDNSERCPQCPKPPGSSYERRMEILLNDYEYKFQTQFSLLNFPRYKYDFIIYHNDKKVLVEIEGRQHFEYIPHFHETEEYYQKRRNDDIIKTKNALNAGYKLIRLDYQYLDKIDDLSLIEFIKISLASSEQFITTNKEMYKWIYDAINQPKPRLKII